MTVFDDLNKLKKLGLPQIVVVFGEDVELVSELRDQLFSFTQFDSADLSQSYFDLRDAEPELVLEELESFPFFSDQRMVVIENLWNLMTIKKTAFDDKQLSRFEHWLDAPVETTQLILILHGKLDSRLRVVKKLKKTAALLEASPLSAQELQRYFMKETGIQARILLRLAEKSNFSFALMKQNLALLTTYKSKEDLTLEDLELVLPKSLQENIFDLTDLILNNHLNAARALVSDLQIQGEDIIKILSILTNSYRLYYQVKLMQIKAMTESEQLALLKIHPYRIKLANQAVRQLSKNGLKKSLALLIELDYDIKTGRADKDILFDVALKKLSCA